MWGEFWLAAFIGFVFLFVPSYVILRALRFSRVSSVACAPLISLLAYSLLAIAFSKLGIWTNGWILFAALCVVAVIVVIACFLKSRIMPTRKAASRSAEPNGRFAHAARIDVALILLYIVVGIAASSYVFLGSMSTPDCTTYTYDDYSHLGFVRSFIERGNFSSLAANYDYDLGDADRYYPAAWHLLSASIITMSNVPLFVGTNASLFLSCAVIYPLSCLFLLRRIFNGNVEMQVVGAFLTLVFAAFPWEFIYYGRLVSNLLAFCFAPLMLGCTLCIFGYGERRSTRIRFSSILFASFVLSVFTQPSVCFTWIVFSVPYLMHLIWNAKDKEGNAYKLQRRVLHVGAFCLLVFLFLIFCYMLPFLYSVTRFKWRAPMSPLDALGLALAQSFPAEGFAPSPGSPILAVLVFVGIFFALRQAKTRWIVLLWVILLFMYVISAGTNWALKNYTTGWWYTDSHRVLAMYAIISYCLAVIGLGGVLRALMGRIKSKGISVLLQGGSSALVAIVLLWPSIAVGNTMVETPFGCLKERLVVMYSVDLPDAAFYSKEEREFVEKAAEITGDAKVFNIPKDGSLFAYASSGMKTLFRWDQAMFSGDASTRIVQRSLDDYASDQSVRNAVDDLGFEYVLLLDKDHEPGMEAWGGLSYKYWTGPISLNEDTPGFELVLSEGGMELYRVLPEAEMAERGQLADQGAS